MKTHSIALIILSFATELIDGKCDFKTPCACTRESGDVINLAALTNLKVNDAVNKYDYLWKPCKNFDIGKLKGVTFYQHAQTPNLYYDIGTDPNVAFTEEGGNVVLDITSKAADRKSKVYLNCTSGATQFQYLGEFPELQYNFVLHSPYCCPGGHKGGSGGSSGISVGSILTIVFFVTLILYMIIGVAYQVKVREAQGSERVPNYPFWSALPSLIKDGFKFTVTCGSRDRSVYSRI